MGVKVREKLKGSGVWWLIIHHEGRKTTKQVGTKQEAEKAASIVRAQLVLGEPLATQRRRRLPTLAEYFEKFQKGYLKTAVNLGTQKMYAESFVRILPQLGRRQLDQLSRADVENLAASMVSARKRSRPDEPKYSKTTIRITLGHLRALLNHAKSHRLLQENVAAAFGKLIGNAVDRHEEPEPLNEQEMVTFLEAVREHSPQHFELFLCALHTGLRSAELAGLKWSDLDFRGRFVVVRRAWYRGRETRTKTKKIRKVDLSLALSNALEELKRRRREEWLQKGKNEIPEWVFCNRAGKALDMKNLVRRHFNPCLEKAGLRRIRFHDLRHTFATLLIQKGEPIAYAQKQLGHSSIMLTVDTYCHWMPGENREAVDRLPALEPVRLSG